ncbi:MAG TPA: hypothetical protein VHW66_13015 [Stellaceae bacterium]|jgi:hypothetical protein|nr:hypothetical protein [Stellaceae bacterium]
MAVGAEISASIDNIASADTWNRRVSLIRQIPETFGQAHHQEVYSAIAEAVYVAELAPDFAYIHWRDEYELPAIERAYAKATALTRLFKDVDAVSLQRVIVAEPETLRIFRLFLGFTTQEFAAATTDLAGDVGGKPLSNSRIKSLEAGRRGRGSGLVEAASVVSLVIDRGMRGTLFPEPSGDLRYKISKPDTADGWDTIRKYATKNVPFPVFLHQRHYGGAYRQLLDATSGRRGGILEDAVTELFVAKQIRFVTTGQRTKEIIADRFGITVTPAPDFVIYDRADAPRAFLECKQANDGGTARDKAARFATLRREGMRLGGVPVFAVLAGLGWRRTGDTLGPVVRDTDGRVFTAKTLDAMLSVDPFPSLLGETPA